MQNITFTDSKGHFNCLAVLSRWELSLRCLRLCCLFSSLIEPQNSITEEQIVIFKAGEITLALQQD